MSRCICETTCYTPTGIVYAGQKDKADRLIEYDVNPMDPWGIHFKFFDPDDERMRNANRLLQERDNLNMAILMLDLPKEVDKSKRALARVEAQLKDIPNEWTNKVLQYRKRA
jgi:hypothetical protein